MRRMMIMRKIMRMKMMRMIIKQIVKQSLVFYCRMTYPRTPLTQTSTIQTPYPYHFLQDGSCRMPHRRRNFYASSRREGVPLPVWSRRRRQVSGCRYYRPPVLWHFFWLAYPRDGVPTSNTCTSPVWRHNKNSRELFISSHSLKRIISQLTL